MLHLNGTQSTHRLIAWFSITTILPAVALVWVGWRMAGQDRTLQRQRTQEERDQAAELAATALQRTVAELEERLAAASGHGQATPVRIDDGAALVVFGADGVEARGGLFLPYYPAVSSAEDLPPDRFARADALEFGQKDPAAALTELRSHAAAADAVVRAGALLRQARIFRKTGQTAQALAAFGALIELDGTRVDGWPAGLLGRQGRGLLRAALGQRIELASDAVDLLTELHRGRWILTRAQYYFSASQARSWLGQTSPPPANGDAVPLATAAAVVWEQWRGGVPVIDRRRTLWAGEKSILVLTSVSPDRLVVLLAGPQFLDVAWRQRLKSISTHQDIDFALSDGSDGSPVLGVPSVPLDRQSVRSPSATGLPWTVHAIRPDTTSSLSAPARLMLAALAGMTLVVIVGGYFMTRAIAREVAVARVQSEFVAAVSHEFRTPLTTLRHLSELLVAGRVSSEGKRLEFYETMLRESHRLHGLVEGLLNFARLEAGQLECRLAAVEPAHFLREVVEDFQADAARGQRIQLDAATNVPRIRADRDLLARVVWNLLDNAVKYSPPGSPVRVQLRAARDHAQVLVIDHGFGIPQDEQTEIFGRFVRGSAARVRAIKGTGIGLAMAREIVRAHRGDITVESVPGQGSTFTINLPYEPVATAAAAREATA
jgi:signal transduction histidine kinase